MAGSQDAPAPAPRSGSSLHRLFPTPPRPQKSASRRKGKCGRGVPRVPVHCLDPEVTGKQWDGQPGPPRSLRVRHPARAPWVSGHKSG